MMRIIAGRWGGRQLAELGRGDPAARLRPTTDRVRESLFALLEGGRFGDPIREARVLDLFAGTGALGLEALSRGAAHATFVDSGTTARALLRENITRLGAQGQARVLRRDATRIGRCPGRPATLVFLDPPWGRGLGERALTAAEAGGWIAPGALIVWEEGGPVGVPAGFTLIEERRRGDAVLRILRADGAQRQGPEPGGPALHGPEGDGAERPPRR